MRREFKKKSKVLLIDDNYEHLVGIRELLNLEGTFDVVGIATNVTVGLNLIKKYQPDVVLLDLKGKELSSEEFALKMDNLISQGVGTYCFVIGGSLGLSEMVRKRANFAFSFSRLTFTHQMVRLLVLEQIYRAFKINNNETYHK